MDQEESKQKRPIGEKGIWPIAKRYGIIGGLVLIIYFLIGNLLQINYPVNPIGFVFYSIFSLFVRVGILIFALRLDASNFQVNFKRAFFLSFIIGIIAFTIESAFDTFFVTVVDTEFINHYVKSFEALYRSTDMEKELVNANVKLIREVAESRKNFLSNIFGLTLQSAFIALMVAFAFVRGNRRNQHGK